MKKTLFLAIMAGAALAGCVKNEPVAKADGSPELITFEAPVVSVPTKATEIADNYPKSEDFAVFALYHENEFSAYTAGTLYMNDVTCKANKKGETETPDYWAPATDYYWPKKGYLTFAAYAPSSVTATWGETGFKFENFTVAGTSLDNPNTEEDDPKAVNPTGQYDLLYSERVYNVTRESTNPVIDEDNPYDGVTIPFKHALSSIVFTAKAEAEYTGTTIKITGIKVNNVVSKGTFNQNLQDDKLGDSDEIKPAWTVSTDANDVKNYVVFTGAKELSTTTQYFNADDPSADDFANTVNANGKRNSDLILIPQVLNEQKSADGSTVTKSKVTVTVDYEIINNNNTDDTTDDTTIKQSSTFDLAVGASDGDKTYEWVMGYRYTYNISIGLYKIYFNPTVTPYETVTPNTDGGGRLE